MRRDLLSREFSYFGRTGHCLNGGGQVCLRSLRRTSLSTGYDRRIAGYSERNAGILGFLA